MRRGRYPASIANRLAVASGGLKYASSPRPPALREVPFIGSAAEPLVSVLPVAKPFRQIAPRNSGAVAVEHRFDQAAIVVGGDADITGFAGQQILDSLRLVIAKCISVHRSAL